MTLILGMSKPEGIYLSVDYRVTNSNTKKLIDDKSVKFLVAHYPPDQVGPKALFAYTGIALLGDGTPVGDWLRETPRGESDTFNASMQHLLERLNRDFARYRQPLIINALVTDQNRRFFGGLSNMMTTGVADSFGYELREVSNTFVFANGSGGMRVRPEGHLDFLWGQINVRPRRVHDHMKLLAAVNRRVADADDCAAKASGVKDAVGAVSPHCHVAFINGDDQNEPAYKVFTADGKSAPFEMHPMLLFGIDFKVLMEAAMRAFAEAGDGLPQLDIDEINKNLKRRS